MKHKIMAKMKRDWDVAVIVVFFVVYFLIGLMVFDDYGFIVDDSCQRLHSLVNYKYVMRVIFGRYVLPEIPELKDYSHMYGVALQLPMVFYEHVKHWTLTPHEIFRMRHLCFFFTCFIGYVFFYLSLGKIFNQSKIVPIFGVMFVSLYPRFFSMQFVDIKNLGFAATCMIAFYFMVMAVEKKKVIWQISFGCAAALAANTRMMAVVFPAVLLGYYLLADLTGKDSDVSPSQRVVKYVAVACSFFLFWYIITPMAWRHPTSVFVKTFKTFAWYEAWDGTMVFMGRLIKCSDMPWHYLFVWFGISIPVYLLLLFLIGHIRAVRKIVKNPHGLLDVVLSDFKWFFCAAVLFWGSVLSVIIMRSRIYIGWHHMYFVFVPFCVCACYGFDCLLRTFKPKIVIAAISFLLFLQCIWIVRYHPFQSSYFNIIGKPVASNFDREEWRLASKAMLDWICKNQSEDFSVSGEYVSVYVLALPKNEQKRITLVNDGADYILEFYTRRIGNTVLYDGYEEVHTAWVDGYKVASVFKKKEGSVEE